MTSVRSLFSNRRPIDRPIEKVIDYYAADEKRLAIEIDEYEVTQNVEDCFRRFLEVFGAGVRAGDVTEVGVWVSGFYGSGKSSFTKYLGFALDRSRTVGGRPFRDRLCDRLQSADIKALLQTLARQCPTAVVLLDLGAEQLADTASAPVSTVLYWKVLQWAGYSKEKKLAQLEFTLDARGLLAKYREAYRERFRDDWEKVHNDPLIGIARADQIVPTFLPEEFSTPGSFRSLKFEEALDVRERARQMIDLIRRKTGCEAIVFLVDEAGQYVAPRGELILNLDGLARNLKELGHGKVWLVATGQQTLAEIVEKAAHNSAELNKLRDRFPIGINLDARDIREITYRRLLTKSPEGEGQLRELFAKQGQAAVTFTRLQGTALFKGDPDVDTFIRLYPFLPQHFDLLLELIRALARSTGGIGLRSAIRVIQDLLVDVSRALAAGVKPIADRTVGTLACADDFYDTLRADIAKVLPHVAVGVEKVARIFPGDPLALRVAKAIAALQAIEGFPRTAENMAALLYPAVGAPSLLEPVREGLRKLVAEKECGVVDDPQSGGYLFLSEGVKPLRDKRNAYVPTGTEINQLRARILASIFDPPPSVMLEGVKKVEAGLRHGKAQVLGEHADIQFRVEAVEAASLAVRRQALLAETNTPEYRNTIALLIAFSGEVDDLLVEACRSDRILQAIPERDADRDVAQFLRAERRQMDASKERAQKAIAKTLYDGVFIFRGGPTAVVEAGATLEAAARNILSRAATDIFSLLRLVAIRPTTDLAAKFLAIERLDRMPKECDPLGFVVPRGGRAGVQVTHPALTEALRAFQQKVDESGAGRLQGGAIQDFFAAAPYGWSKDATRYVFAALLVAGEIELHTPEGVLKTAGPKSIDAFKSTVAFNRAGVSRRDSRPPLETLDRAATRLQEMFGVEVLPLEDHISRAVRTHVPGLIEKVGSLPDRLRLLGLAGEERARYLIETCADLLKEDASGAAVLLGAVECTVPSNAKWARAVTDVLSTGGEADILAAWKVRRDLEELAALFPAQGRGLLAQADEETLREALHSESFHERLPDLRGAVSRTLDRVKGRFAERREAYETDLKAALAALEAMPEWLQLGDEDREEIARNLTDAAVPAEARPGEEVADLRLLLARSASLPSLRTQLEAEVRRRVPKPSEPPLPSEPTVEELLDISELAPADMLRTSTDLENWLSAIRNRLMALLRSNKYVRFKGGRGDELR